MSMGTRSSLAACAVVAIASIVASGRAAAEDGAGAAAVRRSVEMSCLGPALDCDQLGAVAVNSGSNRHRRHGLKAAAAAGNSSLAVAVVSRSNRASAEPHRSDKADEGRRLA